MFSKEKKIRKQEESYQYLKRIFISGNVTTEAQVREHISGLRKKSYRVTVIPVMLLAFGGVFVPKLIFFWLMFSLMGGAWIWSSTYMTIKLMERYISDEVNAQKPKEALEEETHESKSVNDSTADENKTDQ